MCALCGVLGPSNHWTSAIPREGVFTSEGDTLERRRARARKVMVANRILGQFGLRLDDWQGSAFMLSGATGKQELVEDLSHLWAAAERLTGKPCDPLAEALLGRLELGAP